MCHKGYIGICSLVLTNAFVGCTFKPYTNYTLTDSNSRSDEAIATEYTCAERQSATTVKITEAPKITTTERRTAKTSMTRITTTTATSTAAKQTETTTATYPFIIAQNPTVSAVSVSCLKVEWENDDKHSYNVFTTTEAPYTENIQYIFSGDNVCYITGLRENSVYHIVLTPAANDGEKVICVPFELDGHTQTVEVIEEFEREEGWTSCFSGERASGLTAMPSSGAIYGSFADNITGTGIRRKDNGDYCCAMGLYYGTVGDRFLIELNNGIQFTVQVCDSKGWADDADGDGISDGRFHWFGGEGNGKNIIEFIYDDYSLPYPVAFYGSWGIANWNGLNLCSDIASIKKINY